MSISQLSLTDYRGLKSTTLNFHPHINIITGNNGSGKTSLLEAIYVICQACSFRTHQLKQCINHSDKQLLLFSKFSDHKVGLSKSDKSLVIKIDGNPVKRRSELVTRTPISIVNADSFNLITGPPELRRKYIDWCLFHVEQEFSTYWIQFKHALKQRNTILKSRKDLNMVEYWDNYLIEPSEAIQALREKYSGIISNLLTSTFKSLLGEVNLSLEYEQGWPAGNTLKESMRKSRARDIKTGFTNLGIHRDNIKLKTNGKPVVQVLSRGQSKRLCIALQIALLQIVKSKTSRQIILLVDDISSELDIDSQKEVFDRLFEMGIQLFITNIPTTVPEPLKNKEFKMFHVEHGIITPRKTS
jgi:DNA replication and repair protein RecF